jgi:hypothetical protein
MPIPKLFSRSPLPKSDQGRKLFGPILRLAGQNKAQTFLGERSKSSSLLSSQLSRALEQVIGNFNGCLHETQSSTDGPVARLLTSYLGALVAAGTFVDSAPGERVGGALVLIVSGIFDVPDSMPGVLEGAGAVGVVAAGGTAVDGCWRDFPMLLPNALTCRL